MDDGQFSRLIREAEDSNKPQTIRKNSTLHALNPQPGKNCVQAASSAFETLRSVEIYLQKIDLQLFDKKAKHQAVKFKFPHATFFRDLRICKKN